MRLDAALVARGLVETRERAHSLVLAGAVTVGGQRATRPGMAVGANADLAVADESLPYVSRGGLKLAAALDRWQLDVTDRVAIDIGASTGGFTDVLLQRGARRVYAVDVGYGQLHYRLRQDPRVVVMERTNARYLTELHGPSEPELPGPSEPQRRAPHDDSLLPHLFLAGEGRASGGEAGPDLAVADVSFISLRLVLPPVFALLAPDAFAVTLVKPQFEAGRGQVGKGGVVRDPSTHRRVLSDLVEWSERQLLQVVELMASPIRGPAGNVEFLALWRGGDGLATEVEIGRALGESDAVRAGGAG